MTIPLRRTLQPVLLEGGRLTLRPYPPAEIEVSGEPADGPVGKGPSLAVGLSPEPQVATDQAAAGYQELIDDLEREFQESPPRGLVRLAVIPEADWRGLAFPGLSWVFWRKVGRTFMQSICRKVTEVQPIPPILEMGSEQLEQLVDGAPPFPGEEFLTRDRLLHLGDQFVQALRQQVVASGENFHGWLMRHGGEWNLLGRVCLHLADNKQDPLRPFAFLATCAVSVGPKGRPRYLPLRDVMQEFARTGNRAGFLRLLEPLHRAARMSSFLEHLLSSQAIYKPLAWTSREAWQFLQEIAGYEQTGLVCRLPPWFTRGQAIRRVMVETRLGDRSSGELGLSALLSFDARVCLDGEPLSEEEWAALRRQQKGLALVRGAWVEVDPGSLQEILQRFQDDVRRHPEGVTFGHAMRLLSESETQEGGETPACVRHVAGTWLRTVLDRLRSPEQERAWDPGPGFLATLRPYQEVGVRWLHLLYELGLGGCLADDMGLGKTLQVLALLTTLQNRDRVGVAGHTLLVLPASLLGNWQEEIARWTPGLRYSVAHGSVAGTGKRGAARRRKSAGGPGEEAAGTAFRAGIDVWEPAEFPEPRLVMTTYGQLWRRKDLQQAPWDLVILDEGQAIKNPDSRQTKAVKALSCVRRFILTGTPLENRLGDLWSLFDFLQPGLLGSPTRFKAWVTQLENSPGGFRPLRHLVRPYLLRRLKSDPKIAPELPDKIEMTTPCFLAPAQVSLYQAAVEDLKVELQQTEGMKRRGIILAYLTRFKQICDHPSLWLRDGSFEQNDSGKFQNLFELATAFAERGEKFLVFTQYRELTGPLVDFLARVVGKPGLVMHGGTPVKKRQGLVAQFQEDSEIPFLVLTVKVGGVGLNLTAATQVVHVDRWWNPAVEDQATDRAYRIGQKQTVMVRRFVCRGTLEDRIDRLLTRKRELSRQILEVSREEELLLTEMSNEELLNIVSLDLASAVSDED